MFIVVALIVLVSILFGCAQAPAPSPPTPTQVPKAAPAKEAKPEAQQAKPEAKEAKPVAKETKPEAKPQKEVAKAPQKLTKINAAFSAITGAHSGLWVAKERGLFEKYGLDVDLKDIASGSTAVQALVAGELQFAQTGGGPVVSASIAGGDLALIAGTINVLVFSLYARPEIKTVEDLKGKAVAAGQKGTVGDFVARYTLKKFGVEPDREVTIMGSGGPPERLAALLSGGVQAAVIGPPTTLQAKRNGMRELVNITDLAIPYPQNQIAVKRQYLASNQEIVRNFLKAVVEGIAVAKKDRDFTIKVIGKYSKTEDKEILEEAYDAHVPKALPAVPYPTKEAVQAVIDELVSSVPQAKDAKPEQFIDSRLLKELEDSGFVKTLY